MASVTWQKVEERKELQAGFRNFMAPLAPPPPTPLPLSPSGSQIQSIGVMGKRKQVKKFAAVKRMINPSDQRL